MIAILYEQIASNRKKTVLLFIVFFILVQMIGNAVIYIISSSYLGFHNLLWGFIVTTVLTVLYMVTMVSSSEGLIMYMNHAKQIQKAEDNPFLWNTVEGLALAARLPMPKVYIIEEDSPNAFATGLSPEKSAIAVTTALLEMLSREEVEAVIAHELAHIQGYDTRIQCVSLALVSVIAILSDIGIRIIRSDEDKHPAVFIIAIITIVLAPIVAYIMHFSISRNREYLADANGANLCRNPHALASALQKISNCPNLVDNIPPSSASMYIADPFKKDLKNKKKKAGLFSTHPSTEDRIEKLLNM